MSSRQDTQALNDTLIRMQRKINDLQTELERIKTFEVNRFSALNVGLTGAQAGVDDLVVDGDVYTVPWTDYSATSTVTGWVSTTVKQIHYKKIGKTVFVAYAIAGTSNSTATSFTLPFAAAVGLNNFQHKPGRSQDSGSYLGGSAWGKIDASSSTVQFYPDEASAGNWTNSGAKTIIGEFWYEAA